MSKLNSFKSSLDNALDHIRETEIYSQIKSKYDELDNDSKLYLQLGVLGCVSLFILVTVIGGASKVSSLKADLNSREETIGYLQQNGDQLKVLKMQQASSRGGDNTMPLATFVDSVSSHSGIDPAKIEVGSEMRGFEDKEAVESLIEIKMTQTNLRQLTKYLFNLTDMGTSRKLNIKNLNIDTKGDPDGYIDVVFTVASYKAK